MKLLHPIYLRWWSLQPQTSEAVLLCRSTYHSWHPARVHRAAYAGHSARFLSPPSRQAGFQLRSKGHPGCQWKCNPTSFTFHPLQHLKLILEKGFTNFCCKSEVQGTETHQHLRGGKWILLMTWEHLVIAVAILQIHTNLEKKRHNLLGWIIFKPPHFPYGFCSFSLPLWPNGNWVFFYYANRCWLSTLANSFIWIIS